MKQVIVPLADGFEEIEAITIIDVLRRAGIEVVSISISEKLDINGAHGVTVKADKYFKDIDFNKADMIVLPGGMPGSTHLKEHIGLGKAIVEFTAANKYVAAICAAPMVLGNLGVLKNHKATCFPGFEKYLDGANHIPAGVVADRKIVTGKGAGKAMEFSLKLVETLLGTEKSESLAAKLLFE